MPASLTRCTPCHMSFAGAGRRGRKGPPCVGSAATWRSSQGGPLASSADWQRRSEACWGGVWEGALPAWAGVTREAMGFGRAVFRQLRSHLLPRVPAIAGMVVGWWIANTYTDSHVRSVLHSVGIGSGGTRVVSGSAYRAMSFWVPLLAAAACAHMGERLAQWWWEEGTSPAPMDREAGRAGGE